MSIEPELDAPLSQEEKRRKIVLTSDVGESLANMLEGFLTMNTADLFSDPLAREAAEGYASALKLSLEEAKEAEAAAATQLTVDAALQRNLRFAIGLQRVIFGSVTTTEVALANVTATKFRKNLKGIMLTRPPALLGRLPITGMRFKELVVPLASDYRVQVSIAEWGDRVDMTLTDEGVPIEGNDMVDAVIPAGCVRKRYSYKYGTVGVAILTDGIRDAQQIYSIACPANQQPYRISFTLVAPSSITRDIPYDASSGLSRAEWEELLELEAPSIWGLSVSRADVLDDSEPTFDWSFEEAESERMSHEAAASLDAYSPSMAMSISDANEAGFNLHPPAAFDENAILPDSECERVAFAALQNKWVTEDTLLHLAQLLPNRSRNFQENGGAGQQMSCVFNVGAYIHGSSSGVMLNTTGYLHVTMLLTSVVVSAAPDAWFSSISFSLNTKSGVHRDQNNHKLIPNHIVPASTFGRGELWIADPSGDHHNEGILGRLGPVTKPFLRFYARQQRASMDWNGNRLVVISYHVRNPELLSAGDKTLLGRLGFALAE